MDEVTGSGSFWVIADGTAGRRLFDRLHLAGLAANMAGPETLIEPVPGSLYIAVADQSRRPLIGDAVRRGASVLVVPPWPPDGVTLNTVHVTTRAASSSKRDVVIPRFGADAGAAARDRLRILYRDQVMAPAAHSLAESPSGDALLAALPRTSNLDGFLLVTTLLVGTASAQTDLHDLATLLESVRAWAAAASERAGRGTPRATPRAPEEEIADDQPAQLVLLALALAVPQLRRTGNGGEKVRVPAERVRATVAELAVLLGGGADPDSGASGDVFARGWQWLREHGVVSGEETGNLEREAGVSVERGRALVRQWQLESRLRRLVASHKGDSDG